MRSADACDLHDVAMRGVPEGSESLLALARAPLADECQRCRVCRAAREYIHSRLAERAGTPATDGVTSTGAQERLREAVREARGRVRGAEDRTAGE